MLKKIDHIGIAVSDMDTAADKYEHITGTSPAHKETLEEQKVMTTFFPVGDVRLELLQGTSQDSPITKFIKRRGEGIHHICFEVDDLVAAKESMKKVGMEFIPGIPAKGAGGSKVAFIHPKSTGGILFELVEYPKQ